MKEYPQMDGYSGFDSAFVLRPALFRKRPQPEPLPHGVLCLSTVSDMEFYHQFCFCLGLEAKGGKSGMFRAMQEQIPYLYREKKQLLLLAIDETQYLSTGILKDIKILMNYNYDSFNCFTLVL